MKCDDCLNKLEQYIDGEAIERDAAQISAHLITCAACAREFETLTAEQETYAQYDRGLEIPPAMWSAIAARTAAESRATDSRSSSGFAASLAGLFAAPRLGFALPAMAVVILAVMIGLVFLRTRTNSTVPKGDVATTKPSPARVVVNSGEKIPTPLISGPDIALAGPDTGRGVRPISTVAFQKPARRPDQSDVLFTDAAYTDIEDKDTASHLEQAQNLLLSIGSLKTSDDDEAVDVSYEKAESRRLLNENIVLRRDAEMAGKFPAKSVLGSLEPFLIDIANLPDKASANDVRQIKDRVQKTEIVAELRSY